MSYLTTELLTSLLQGKELSAFLNSYRRKYKRLHKLFQNEASLFSFYEFPKSIQQTIYTSNLIENNNKGFRHKAKLKEQFPNEDSLERFACMVYCDYNRRFSGKAHRGFQEADSNYWRCSRIEFSACTIKSLHIRIDTTANHLRDRYQISKDSCFPLLTKRQKQRSS